MFFCVLEGETPGDDRWAASRRGAAGWLDSRREEDDLDAVRAHAENGMISI
ncbi:MAG: hypothetical protein ABFD44_06145 [Anaerolineaceae bacterium]